ncbi:MAG: c-type cytochrome, partial [Betaproteobacteria bacterium]
LTTSELQRTTMMKLSSLATLWDYIRRAMPWNAPKSLSDNDVYAVSAYILHLADLVPAGFVLSDRNIRETEKLLPNRNGMTRRHGLWSVEGKPDVGNVACMTNCGSEAKVRSFLPDYARNAHGNLALQNRAIGGVRGADTTRPAPEIPELQRSAARDTVATSANTQGSPAALAAGQGCLACHGVDRRIVGPGFREVSRRYAQDGASATARLAAKIRAGSSGVWGTVPMPPQPQISAETAEALARWIVAGAPGG